MYIIMHSCETVATSVVRDALYKFQVVTFSSLEYRTIFGQCMDGYYHLRMKNNFKSIIQRIFLTEVVTSVDTEPPNINLFDAFDCQ